MKLAPFSYPFLDWLRAQILQCAEPEINDSNLYDTRTMDLIERIRKSLAGSLGYCAVLDLPQAESVEPKEDTWALLHTISVTLTIIRGPLCKTDTTAIAETLYRFFLTRHFRTVPGLFAPDVYCGPFKAEMDAQGNTHHYFTISAATDITLPEG